MKSVLVRTVLPILITLSAFPLVAQEVEPEAAAPAQAVQLPATAADSREVRGELDEILRKSPPELGTILALDPTLLSNEAFLEGYPAIKSFVAQHPEVRHSPGYYLENVPNPRRSNETAEMRVVNRMLEALSIMSVMLFIALGLFWLVRTSIEQRRWNRMAKLQSEVHNKILDRFGTNDELLRYMDTKAGRRFLESAPIPVQSEDVPGSAPINRILWSIQLGLVITAGALGLVFVSSRFQDSAEPIFALGVIGLCVGAGFITSGFVSMVISRRLGLWRPSGSSDESGVSRLNGPAL